MASDEKRVCVRSLPMYTVDAFTDRPFSGNQAGVCPLPSNIEVEDEILQKIAAEMNIAETAFIKTLKPEDSFFSADRFNLRWFTPTTEVKFCGHATVGSAAILFNKINNKSKSITFKTLYGDLVVQQDVGGGLIVMDAPVGRTEKQDLSSYDDLMKVLFPDPDLVEEVEFCESIKYLLVRIKDGWTRSQFESWSPDLRNLESSVSPGQLVGVIVTMTGTPELGYLDDNNKPYDFLSRFFAPWAGIPEDPVTGSAHTVLSYFWSSRLNKTQLYGRQCSKRGGEVWMEINKDRVLIKGKTAFVLEGNIQF